MKKLAMLTVAAALLLSHPAYAASIKVPVNHVSAEGIGQEMGTVTFEDAPGGGLDILVDLPAFLKANTECMCMKIQPARQQPARTAKLALPFLLADTMIQPKAANTQALKKPAIWVTCLL